MTELQFSFPLRFLAYNSNYTTNWSWTVRNLNVLNTWIEFPYLWTFSSYLLGWEQRKVTGAHFNYFQSIK